MTLRHGPYRPPRLRRGRASRCRGDWLRSCAAALFCAAGTTLLADIAAAQEPAPGTRSGVVSGSVRDSLGVPVMSAEVTLAGFIGRGATSTDGSFRIAAVPPGARTLVVRRIGFRPESLSVVVRSAEVTEVNVRLDPVAMKIAPVVVQAGRPVFRGRMAAFHERRTRAQGHFITAEEIDRRKPMRVTDMLRTVPGVTMNSRAGTNLVTFRGRGCAPLVWIDGAPAASGYFDPDLITPHSIAGIELYSGPATVPPELMFVRSKGQCGVIAIWTRVPEPRPRQGRRVTAHDLAIMVNSLRLYTAEQVDEPAALFPGDSILPTYPDSLQRQGVPGHVLVEFVVDTAGRAEMDTFGAVIASDRLFTDAVRRAVSAARFTPARHEGRPVQQLVQLSFRFVLPEAPGARSDGGGR